MSIITSFYVFAIIEFILESLLWGSFGFFVFRYIGINRKYFIVEIILLLSLYIAWDFYLMDLISKLDISIGNQELLTYFEVSIDDLLQTDFVDVIIYFVQISVGYFIGYKMFNKFTSKLKY